jgi:hypothetical protein
MKDTGARRSEALNLKRGKAPKSQAATSGIPKLSDLGVSKTQLLIVDRHARADRRQASWHRQRTRTREGGYWQDHHGPASNRRFESVRRMIGNKSLPGHGATQYKTIERDLRTNVPKIGTNVPPAPSTTGGRAAIKTLADLGDVIAHRWRKRLCDKSKETGTTPSRKELGLGKRQACCLIVDRKPSSSR